MHVMTYLRHSYTTDLFTLFILNYEATQQNISQITT